LVQAVAFLSDGCTLVSASDDRTVKLWDVATGQYRQTLTEHTAPVRSVAFSSDGCTLASASDDRTVKLWDVATGRYRQTLAGHRDSVRSVAFSSDGRTLASASDDYTVKLWDMATGQCRQTLIGRYRQTLIGHRHSVRSVAFSSDGRTLASASSDLTIKLWDVVTGQCRQTLAVGRVLYTISFGSTDSCIHTEIGTISLDSSPSLLGFGSLMTSPTSKQTHYDGYGISTTGAWIMWNSEKVLWLPSEYRPRTSAVTGSTIAFGCSSGRVLIWQFSSGPPLGV
jgi:WD40 repeat protein